MNKYRIGVLVRRREHLAIINSLEDLRDGHFLMSLDFITPTPNIYYSCTDGWEALGEASSLLLELM